MFFLSFLKNDVESSPLMFPYRMMLRVGVLDFIPFIENERTVPTLLCFITNFSVYTIKYIYEAYAYSQWEA